MKKCDCLNFCGDTKPDMRFTKQCTNYHAHRIAALNWVARFVPVWDPTATRIMHPAPSPIDYLFFSDVDPVPTGFLFTFEEVNKERERLFKSPLRLYNEYS